MRRLFPRRGRLDCHGVINVSSFLAVSVFHVSLFIGVYGLWLDPKEASHRLFFLTTGTAAAWNLLPAFMFSAPTEERVWFWFRPAASVAMVFAPITLHSVVALTRTAHRRWHLLALYALSFPAHYGNWTSYFMYNALMRVGREWIFLPDYGCFWFYYWGVYTHGIIILWLVLLHNWRKSSVSARVRQQARIISYSLLVLVLVASVPDNLFVHTIPMPALTPVYFVSVIAGTAYAMVRYRFLSITHATVSRDIVDNMDASIVLLDTNGRIVGINRKAEAVLNVAASRALGRPVESVIGQGRLLVEGLRRVMAGRADGQSYLVQIPHDLDPTIVELKLSLVKDEMGEALGALVLGQEVRARATSSSASGSHGGSGTRSSTSSPEPPTRRSPRTWRSPGERSRPTSPTCTANWESTTRSGWSRRCSSTT